MEARARHGCACATTATPTAGPPAPRGRVRYSINSPRKCGGNRRTEQFDTMARHSLEPLAGERANKKPKRRRRLSERRSARWLAVYADQGAKSMAFRSSVGLSALILC